MDLDGFEDWFTDQPMVATLGLSGMERSGLATTAPRIRSTNRGSTGGERCTNLFMWSGQIERCGLTGDHATCEVSFNGRTWISEGNVISFKQPPKKEPSK